VTTGNNQRAALGRRVRTLARAPRALMQPLVAVAVALAIGAALIVISGNSAGEAYKQLWNGAFGTEQNLADSLRLSTTLFFESLAFTFAFRAGVFNAGTQGQFYMGAFGAAWVGFTFKGLPGPLIVLIALAFGLIGGAVWAIGPAILRERWRVNEIVTTLMMTYIAVLLGQYLVVAEFSTVGGQIVSTPPIAASAHLGTLLPPSQLNWAVFIGIGLIFAYGYFIRQTTTGYEMEVVGQNVRAANYAGFASSRLMLFAMIGSGAIAGLGGAQEILGVQYSYLTSFSPDVGLTGIIASLLARNRPLALIPAAIFLGALQNGALNMQIFTNVDRNVITVVSSLIVVFATATVMPGWRRELARTLRRVGTGVRHPLKAGADA
jgi:simple sugar transport system permease protein